MAKTPLTLAKLPLAAKVGTVAALVVTVGLAYFLLFYADISEEIASQKRQVLSLKTDLENVKQSEFAYHKDLAELAERQQRQRDLNKLLPDTTEYPSFLSSVQGVANVSGVALQGWTPQDEIPLTFFAKVPMKLSLMGKFHQVAKFFYGVGQLDRVINIENISLREPKAGADDVSLHVECLATAFHSVTPKVDPKKDPAKP